MPILPGAMNRFEAEIIAAVERIQIEHRDNPAAFRRAADAYVEDVAMRLEHDDGRGIIRALASRHADRAFAKIQFEAAANAPQVRAWRLPSTGHQRRPLQRA
jgi:hypothetical protein